MSQEVSGKTATKFDPRMLEALACPRTHGTLDYDADAQELSSTSAKLAFRVREASHIYMVDDAGSR